MPLCMYLTAVERTVTWMGGLPRVLSKADQDKIGARDLTHDSPRSAGFAPTPTPPSKSLA